MTVIASSVFGQAGQALGGFLPRLGGALALLVIGVLLARLISRVLIKAMEVQLAQLTVLVIFRIIAAAQIAVSTLVLLILIGILLAAVAGTFALAFGLGGRDVARALSAGRYLRHDYVIGQEIGFADVRGRITHIESTSTVLDAGDGRALRVPNHLLMESVVIIYGAAGPDTAD